LSNFSIEELAVPQGLDEAAAELHGIFAAQLGRTARRLRDAAQRGDREEVARLCGRLAGGASVYGYKKLASFLSRAEVYLLCGELSVFDVALGVEDVTRRICGTLDGQTSFETARDAEAHASRPLAGAKADARRAAATQLH
jgi:HPt (histidine-containing phosphotransfer) domain-containing protein